MVAQCLLVSMGGIETNAKSSLLRRIRARCMDLTVNQWLAGFDSQMRSKEDLCPCNSVESEYQATNLGVGGSSPSRGAKQFGGSSGLRSSLARKMSRRIRFPRSPPS